MAKAYAGGEVLAEVVRSGFVESWHRGSCAVLDADGALVDSAGDPRGAVFPRSSNKPMQAVGMLRAGLRLPDPALLALAAASHSGEPAHIDGVRAMLRCGGLDETALGCPPDFPIGEQARQEWLAAGRGKERIAMNCSGKHSGMLLTCLAAGWPTEGYRDPGHPLQKHLRSTVEDLAGETVAATGVDGCGAPVFALSLRGLAAAFLRIVSAAPGTAEGTVADAMRAHPDLVGGSGPEREDSRLMLGVSGLLAKGGAEGVTAVAVPGVGALAVKVDDGNKRPIGSVVVAALRQLGLDEPVFEELVSPPAATVYGGGVPVGAVRVVWSPSR